ncbi:MAG: hypothetical protein NT080_07155 [Spirochaetes bacterium]|nr:hypothetical protein [Spirochaetota bacterium]
MDTAELDKIDAFLEHLFSLPDMRNETIIGAEYQIVNFIRSNLARLQSAFRGPQYFPDLDPRETLAMVFSRLGKRVVAGASPFFEGIIRTGIDFNILNKVRKDRVIDASLLREKLVRFVGEMLDDPVARLQYRSVSYIFRSNALEKYLRAIYDRKGCIYNELVRMQRSPLSPEEYAAYFKVFLLLKPYAYFKTDNRNVLSAYPGAEEKRRFTGACRGRLEGRFPEIDPVDVQLALDANLPEFVLEKWEAAARLLYILSARYAEYDPNLRSDRGAESPDRSWYGVARPLCGGFGYYRGFLDELYMIAADLHI